MRKYVVDRFVANSCICCMVFSFTLAPPEHRVSVNHLFNMGFSFAILEWDSVGLMQMDYAWEIGKIWGWVVGGGANRVTCKRVYICFVGGVGWLLAKR